MEEQKGKLDQMLDMMKELKDEKQTKKEKPFKLPFMSRVGKGAAKKNFATVMVISENRNVDFKKMQIIDQTIMLNGVPRLAAGEFVLNFKNKPLIVIPEWSVQPLSPSENFKNSLINGSNSAGYRLLMARMQTEAIKLGKKIGGWGISIGVLVIGGIIAWALIKG